MVEARRLYHLGEYPSQHLWGSIELERAGFDVRTLPWVEPAHSPAGRFGPRLRTLREQVGYLTLRDTDVLYAANPHSLTGVAALRSRLKVGPAIMAVFHPGIPETPAMRAAARGCDVVITLSSAVSRHLIDVLGRPAETTHTLAWGPDLSFGGYMPKGDDWLLSCGKTGRDLDTLMAALDRTRVRARVYSGGLPMASPPPGVKINQACWTTYPMVLADLQRASIVAIPLRAHRALLGLTELNDALALAKPVVITSSEFLDVDVAAIGCGIVVGAGDVGGWSDAIGTLAADPVLRRRMGEAGRRYAEERWNARVFGAGVVRAAQSAVGHCP